MAKLQSRWGKPLPEDLMKKVNEKPVPKDHFGFTLKILGSKEPTHEDYIPMIARMSKIVEVVDFVYEDKSKKGEDTRLHIHGIFQCQRNPYFKTIFQEGIHIKVERLYDEDGWKGYINKNVNPQDSPKINNQEYLF